MTAQSKMVMQAATDRLNNVGPRGNCHWLGWEIRHPGGPVADCGYYSVYGVHLDYLSLLFYTSNYRDLYRVGVYPFIQNIPIIDRVRQYNCSSVAILSNR